MTYQEAVNLFRNDFDNIGLTIANEMSKEIAAQGHKATGKLLDSVARETTKLLDGIETTISHLDYGVFVNSGVSASKIPYRQKSGASSSKFITALMEWVRFKQIAGGLEKNILRATFAIAKKMKKEGMPTSGSFRYSSNGRRLQWIDYVANEKDAYINSEVSESYSRYIENVFWSIIEEIAAKHKSIEA